MAKQTVMASVEKRKIAAALAMVGKFVSRRSTMPVLGNVLIKAGPEQLVTLAATNLEVTLQVAIQGEVTESFTTTMPIGLLDDWVKAIGNGSIHMEFVERTETLKLSTEGSNASIKGIAAAEYPILFSDDGRDEAVVVPLDPSFIAAIERVTYAASDDESRPTLCGVDMEVNPGGFTLAATDGYRLAVENLSVDLSEEQCAGIGNNIIVPASSLNLLTPLARGFEEIQATVFENRLEVSAHQTEEDDGDFLWFQFGAQRIEARFPDYRAIIPKDNHVEVTAFGGDLERATRVAHLFARENANIVRFSAAPNGVESPMTDDTHTLTISGLSAEMGEGTSTVDVEIDGDLDEIAFNAKYLLDTLKALGGHKVWLGFTQATRPMLVKPIDPATGQVNDDSFAVVMPMHQPK